MNTKLLQALGEIAGVGGLAFGFLLIVFRDVIRKKVFPTLSTLQAYRLLRLIVVLSWSLAILGLLAWTYLARLKTPWPSLEHPATSGAQSVTSTESPQLGQLKMQTKAETADKNDRSVTITGDKSQIVNSPIITGDNARVEIHGQGSSEAATGDASLIELERILEDRSKEVESWLREQKSSDTDEKIKTFRRLHKKHIAALRNRQFVLAHETLLEIDRLLGENDSARYNMSPEYGYLYPGDFDSNDMYLALKSADATIKAALIKSLFVGMVSREHAVMEGTDSFQFTNLNTGICLVRAVSEQDLSMVQALLAAGFNPNIRVVSRLEGLKGDDYTPLMIAAYKGNKPIVLELLQSRARVAARNSNGETAAQVARKHGHDDIATLLGGR